MPKTKKEGVLRRVSRGLEGKIPKAPADETKEERFKRLKSVTPEKIGFAIGTIPTSAMMTPRMEISKAALNMLKQPGLTKKAWAKLMSWFGVLDEDEVLKVMKNPQKFLKGPMSQQDELFKINRLGNKMSSNIDDLLSFKTKTLEDAVANAPAYSKATVNLNSVIDKIDDVVREANKMKTTALSKADMKFINNLKTDVLAKGRYLSEGGNQVSFKDAHELKKTIYKVMKSSYAKPDYTDDAARAFKGAAKELNRQMRDLSPEYLSANDQLSPIYGFLDDIGKEGAKEFTGVGGAKYLKNLSRDPAGRQILMDLESAIPRHQRVMPHLLDLEETQALAKKLSGDKFVSKVLGPTTKAMIKLGSNKPAIGMAGGGGIGTTLAGFPLGTIAGGTAGGIAGTLLQNPQMTAELARPAYLRRAYESIINKGKKK